MKHADHLSSGAKIPSVRFLVRLERLSYVFIDEGLRGMKSGKVSLAPGFIVKVDA